MWTQQGLVARGLALVAATVAAAPAAAAITAAPGWAVHSIPTPGTVQGAVVRRGNSILVGQGAFGVGLEQVIRLDGGAATTIATGFNSLGGFALDAAGTLYVVDNGGEVTGAVTGDTVYAIPNALTRTTALPALGAEVVPSGTIPFAQDVALDGADLLVSDGAGPGAGRVVRVSGGSATDLITGLDYAAGVTVDGTRLLVGNVVVNVDGSSVGSLTEYTLAGAPVAPVATGLKGNYAHDIDNDGNILITGGFTDDPSSRNVIAVAPGGGISERAAGFSFSSELFHDATRNETLVLDFGVAEIAAICRDTDGNGICNADEACSDAVTIVKPKLQLKKLDTPAGDDGLTFSGEMTVPTSPALDPVAKGAHVVVADANGPVADVAIPPGPVDPATKIGWKPNRSGTTWKYSNKAGLSGIITVSVKTTAKTPGLVKFKVVGKNGAFPTTPAGLPLEAVFTLDAAGQCGTVDFSGPLPICDFNDKASTVKCK
jgi:hypothetical protein